MESPSIQRFVSSLGLSVCPCRGSLNPGASVARAWQLWVNSAGWKEFRSCLRAMFAGEGLGLTPTSAWMRFHLPGVIARLRLPGKSTCIKAKPALTADAVLAKPRFQPVVQSTERIIALGAPRGATEALREFLGALPADSPGIIMVQHLPDSFSEEFAARFDGVGGIKIREARDGDPIVPGQALIAPRSKHLILQREHSRYFARLKDGPLVSRHRPSVDVLFRSVARFAGPNAVGVALAGLGEDGIRGLLEMRATGAVNFGQLSSSKSGPHHGVSTSSTDAAERSMIRVVPLDQLAGEVLRACRGQ